MLTVYADESGKGDPTLFVMGGLISRAEAWSKFSSEWNKALSGPPGPSVRSFHLIHAKRLGVDVKIPKLAEVVRKYALGSFLTVVPMDDFNKIVKGRIGKQMDAPDFMALTSVLVSAAFWQIQRGLSEKMEFIFDEQKSVSDFIQGNWTELHELLPDEVKCRVGGRPTHRPDEDSPPLQAADLFAGVAWRVGMALHEGVRPAPGYKELFSGVPSISHFLSAKTLQRYIDNVRAKNREAMMCTEHEALRLIPVRDKAVSSFNVECVRQAVANQTVRLQPFQATQTKRFLLVHRCDRFGNPHLHKRSGNVCLAPPQAGLVADESDQARLE